jgi:undecaprenyl-diphosphatase
VALLAFALVATAVTLRRTATFDAWAAGAVRRAASPAVDAVARAVTGLASGVVTLAAAAAAVALALHAGERRLAGVLAAAWAVDVGAVELLKVLVGRARPSFAYTCAALRTGSVPSGHSANAVAVWALLAVVAGRRSPRLRTPALVAAGLFAGAAGFSRVYLGVHFPTDVLGGWAAGAAILALASSALPAPGPAGDVAGARRDARGAPGG